MNEEKNVLLINQTTSCIRIAETTGRLMFQVWGIWSIPQHRHIYTNKVYKHHTHTHTHTHHLVFVSQSSNWLRVRHILKHSLAPLFCEKQKGFHIEVWSIKNRTGIFTSKVLFIWIAFTISQYKNYTLRGLSYLRTDLGISQFLLRA